MKNTRHVTLKEVVLQERLTHEPGLLKGVKVLGLVSENRRRYLPEAVREALPLYEGAKVNIDHPARGDEPRPLDARFGRLVNVRVADDGLWGDLKYNPAHRLAATVQWWAENDPGAIGLSHNAVGAGRTEGGVYVVEKIVGLRSVDVVCDPATTKGLFESRQSTVKITLKKILEALSQPKKAVVNRLVEMGYMSPETEMDAPADAPDDHEAALKAGFASAAGSIIDKALEGGMEPKEALAKLKDLLTAHAKLNGKDAGGEGGGEGDTDRRPEVDEQVKNHPLFKALQGRLDRLEVKDALAAKQAQAARLCKEARLPDVAVTPVFMEQLLGCPDESAMKAAIEDRKAVVGAGRPKSLPAGTVVAGVAEGAKMTDDDFLRAIKR